MELRPDDDAILCVKVSCDQKIRLRTKMQFFLHGRKNEGCSKREFTMIVMYMIDNNCATKMLKDNIIDRRKCGLSMVKRECVRVKPKDFRHTT